MKLQNILQESNQGEICFIDIDETLFHTFAHVKVLKNGKVVRELDNQEFNKYELQPGESYDFDQFKNAELFRKTSIPIDKTVRRVKKMLSAVRQDKPLKIIFLTARSDFDDKEKFLQTFRDHGINVDKAYVERAGNLSTGTSASRKQYVAMKYLMTGKYAVARMIDDDLKNLKGFLQVRKMLKNKGVDVKFFALQVLPDGTLKRVLENETK